MKYNGNNTFLLYTPNLLGGVVHNLNTGDLEKSSKGLSSESSNITNRITNDHVKLNYSNAYK